MIQASIFGAIADINQWGQFSCIDENGKLDKEKYKAYMRKFADFGADATRELPFLVTDRNHSGPKQRNFLPAQWNGSAYDWNHLNQTYYDNFKEMIKIANWHYMAFEISVFDRCHGHNLPDSPWNLNANGFKGYYDWNRYVEKHVKKMIETAKLAEAELNAKGIQCQVLWELENEPLSLAFTGTAIKTLQMLLAAGYKKDQIEDGPFYFPRRGGKTVVEYKPHGALIKSEQFEALKKAKRKAEPSLYVGKDKSKYFTTVHNFADTPEKLKELAAAITHTRRFSISDDGEKPKPGAEEWKKRLIPIFKKAKFNNINKWKFEHLYRGDLQGNSIFDDKIDGTLGISQAYKDKTGVWPPNHPKVRPPFPPPIKPLDPATVYVTGGYWGILGRPPDPLGLQSYFKFLKEEGNILEFCRSLAASEEFKRNRAHLSPKKLAEDIYEHVLKRRSDPGGLAHTIEMIQQGLIAERVTAVLQSEEFKSMYNIS